MVLTTQSAPPGLTVVSGTWVTIDRPVAFTWAKVWPWSKAVQTWSPSWATWAGVGVKMVETYCGRVAMAWLTSAAEGTRRAALVGAAGAAGAAAAAAAGAGATVVVGALVVGVALTGALVVGVVAGTAVVGGTVVGATVVIGASGATAPGWRAGAAASSSILAAAMVAPLPLAPGWGMAPALTATPTTRVMPAIPARTPRLNLVSICTSPRSSHLVSGGIDGCLPYLKRRIQPPAPPALLRRAESSSIGMGK